MRLISLTVVLFLFWLALSGHFTPFLLAAGAGSTVLCALVAARLRTADAEGHPMHLTWSALKMHPRPGWVRGDQAASIEILGQLAKANRRIGELEALQLADVELTETDLTFQAMDVGYIVSRKQHHHLMKLDDIFLVLGAALAMPCASWMISRVVEGMIKKEVQWADNVDVLSVDATRIQSYLFAKGLILIDSDGEERTCQISEKGRRVLSVLMAAQGDDPPPPAPF